MSAPQVGPSGAPTDGAGTLPHVSVVMTTYNRAELLGDAVRSVLAQEGTPPYELVVVDNNSSDETRAVVEALVPGSGGRLRYLFEPKQGASHGRNAGAAAARGEILAFTDDDVRAAPNWLAEIVRAFADHPEVDYVGGRVRPIWPAPPPTWMLAHAHTSPFALIDYGDAPTLVTPQRFHCFVTANLAVRRRAFAAVGGFDPRYQHEPGAVTAIEDHELQIRLLNAGRVGLYAPAAEIRAEVQANRLQVGYHRRWWFENGQARARLTPAGHLFDGECTITPAPPHARYFLGAPLFMYRELLTSAARAVRARARRAPADAYWWEFIARRALGYITYRATHRAAGRRTRAPAPPGSPANGLPR